MLPRLLYAAVALCLLGTRSVHPAARPSPSVEAPAPAVEAAAMAPRPLAPRAVGGAPADFAIPRIQR